MYFGNVINTNSKVWCQSAVTNSSGVAILYPTDDGTAGGNAIFTDIAAIQVTADNNTSTVTAIPLGSLKSLSTDKKTLTVNVLHAVSAIIGGFTLAFAGAGVLVYATIVGD